MRKKRKAAFILSTGLIALSLSACGGGGNHPAPLPPPPTPPVPPPPPPPPPSGNNDAEYQASNSATSANALPAYELGAAGRNVKVAVVDTGINPTLPEFAGRIDPASRDVAANRGLVDQQGHGSMVSGVIAANRDGQYMQGVAYEATILSLNVYDPGGCKPGQDCFLDEAIPVAIDLARTNGARVINMSFGDEEGLTEDIYRAIREAADAGIIMVMAAGNAGIADPNSFAVRNVQEQGASGLFIIAGAMDSNRSISSFSNRAGTGVGAQYFLTALGRGNATVNQLGQHVAVNGTSFATPTIVGAAALLAGAFPNLTGAQIVQLLLTTADDAGAPGIDPIYGRGILNIGRAFQPQGAIKLAGSAAAVSLTNNGVRSAAMGDAAPSIGGGAIILDGFSRAYALDLAKTLSRAPVEQPLRQAMGGQTYTTGGATAGPLSVAITTRRDVAGGPGAALIPMRLGYEDGRRARVMAGMAISRLTPKTTLALGFSQSGRALQQQLAGYRDDAFLIARDPMARTGFQSDAGTSLGLRHDLGPIALSIVSERGKVYNPGPRVTLDRPGYEISSFTIDRKTGRARFSLGGSLLREESTQLGGYFSSAFSSGGSSTAFVDAAASIDLGQGWEAVGSYRRGSTSVRGTGALVAKGRFATEAFAFDVSKAGLFSPGDKLAFRAMQPLRIASGGFDLNVPVGYDHSSGLARYEQRFFNLAPGGREIDYELAYGVGLLGGRFDFNAFLRSDPGHIEAMDKDVGAAIRFTLGR